MIFTMPGEPGGLRPGSGILYLGIFMYADLVDRDRGGGEAKQGIRAEPLGIDLGLGVLR